MAGIENQTATADPCPLTPDEQRRYEAFMAFVSAKEEAWARMSPAERQTAETGWQHAMKNMNDARGDYRKVFLE